MIPRRPPSVDALLESVRVQSGGRAAEPPRFQMGARGEDGGDGWQRRRREGRKVKRANNAEGEREALSPSPLFGVRKKTKKPKTKQNNKCRVRRAGSQFSFSPRSLEWSTSAPWCRLLEKGWRVSAYRWSGWLPGSVMLPRWRTGSGWASVLKTQLSRGIRSSLENSRYRYLSVSARKKLCCTSSYVGLEE